MISTIKLIELKKSSVKSMLRKMLEDKEYNCILATNTTEARSCFEKQGFDLLLLDIVMPGESGPDLPGHVAQEYPDTAVAMVTEIDDLNEARSRNI